MRFFFDNCVALRIARAIRELAAPQRIEVVHLSDLFEPNVRDVEWISSLRSEGNWIIISGDTRISRNPAERAAWQESGLTAFFLDETWSRKQIWVQSYELVGWFPVIVQTARDCLPGSGFKLPSKGKAPQNIYVPRVP